MGLSTEIIFGLLEIVGRELLLFSAFGIVLIGLDDLLFDFFWLGYRRARKTIPAPAKPPLKGPLAIFLPVWREEHVLSSTIAAALRKWDTEDFRIYLGFYPNDKETLLSVSQIIEKNSRLRPVIAACIGPTTKGDNLNNLWHAMIEDEHAENIRFAAVVLHDAEDIVHASELTLFRRYLAAHTMVQIPVVPRATIGSPWVSAHYCDEFAETHGKDMPMRSAFQACLPSAGVGCAFVRDSLAALAVIRGGNPFCAKSLVEDYEIGMILSATYGDCVFIDAVDKNGSRIVSQGEFPSSIAKSVRQKARWIEGIALAGWDRLGWANPSLYDAKDSAKHRALRVWMLWRDRRTPLTALVVIASYSAIILHLLTHLSGHSASIIEISETSPALQPLLMMNFLLLLWRLSARFLFTRATYGWRLAILSPLRVFVSNIILTLSFFRAFSNYYTSVQTNRTVWDKTQHGQAPLNIPNLLDKTEPIV